MSGVYHVVCHDCRFEGVYETAADAEAASGEHRREHGHRVSLLEIERPEPHAGA